MTKWFLQCWGKCPDITESQNFYVVVIFGCKCQSFLPLRRRQETKLQEWGCFCAFFKIKFDHLNEIILESEFYLMLKKNNKIQKLYLYCSSKDGILYIFHTSFTFCDELGIIWSVETVFKYCVEHFSYVIHMHLPVQFLQFPACCGSEYEKWFECVNSVGNKDTQLLGREVGESTVKMDFWVSQHQLGNILATWEFFKIQGSEW